MRVELAVLSHRGRIREENEDAAGYGGWTISGDEPVVLTQDLPLVHPIDVAVADGLGGHRGGQRASRLAVSAYLRAASGGGGLVEALHAADEAVHDEADRDPALRGMGTTLVAVRISPSGELEVVNVGDSRAYRTIGGYLGQLSEDDRATIGRPTLLQVLGGERRVLLEPHFFSSRVRPGDTVLLCSDGLHDVLSEDEIVALLFQPPAAAASALVAATLDRGAPDNVTVAVMLIHETSSSADDRGETEEGVPHVGF